MHNKPIDVDPRCFTCPLDDCLDKDPRCPIHAEWLAAQRQYHQAHRERVRGYNRSYQRERRAKAGAQ